MTDLVLQHLLDAAEAYRFELRNKYPQTNGKEEEFEEEPSPAILIVDMARYPQDKLACKLAAAIMLRQLHGWPAEEEEEEEA